MFTVTEVLVRTTPADRLGRRVHPVPGPAARVKCVHVIDGLLKIATAGLAAGDLASAGDAMASVALLAAERDSVAARWK